MANNDEIRRRARSDYVFRRLTASVIAAAYGVSEVTVGRWKKKAKTEGDDWDMARTAAVMSGQGADVVTSIVLEEYMLQAQQLLHQVKASEGLDIETKIKMMATLADSTAKMVAAASRAAPKLSELGIAQAVVEELVEFVRETHPHHLGVIQELLGPFGDHVVTRFSA